ncbi:MAG: hypothetical protein MJ231_00620 [bacterium]|nr:hypothetical protein [bacterium]
MAQSINNSIVSYQEVEALKEMIFKRAQERADAMEKNIKHAYTSSIKEDVMDLARNSFVAPHNPFSSVQTTEEKEIPETNAVQKTETKDGLGFKPLKIDTQEQVINNEINAKAEIYSTMSEARSTLEKKSSFMGALDFLNSKATIANWERKDKKFNAIA